MKGVFKKKVSLGLVLILSVVLIPASFLGGYQFAFYKIRETFKTAFSNAFDRSNNVESAKEKSVLESPVEQEVNQKISKEVEDEYIAKNIKLYDIQAKYYESFRNEKTAGVDFKIKNSGQKTVIDITVTVYFKNEKGEIIFEDDFSPVSENSYSSNNRKPLKPNYIWQQEQGRFYSSEKVPSEWKEGEIDMKITNIKFEEK